MSSVPTAYYHRHVQGAHTHSEIPEYSTFQHFQWMADVVSSKIICQQTAQTPRYTEHHVYYHFVPMEPGAPTNSRSSCTCRSLFSTPNWSPQSSVESSPESRSSHLETPRVSRIRRGAVSLNPPPPAYNPEPAQTESTQRNHAPTQPVQTQTEHNNLQTQYAYVQALSSQAQFAEPESALTPEEFTQELQCLLIQGRDDLSPVQFHIQGQEMPVSVWRSDQSGPFLVQHYLPNGQEDAISVAHIVNGDRIMWRPPPSIERFCRGW